MLPNANKFLIKLQELYQNTRKNLSLKKRKKKRKEFNIHFFSFFTQVKVQQLLYVSAFFFIWRKHGSEMETMHRNGIN